MRIIVNYTPIEGVATPDGRLTYELACQMAEMDSGLNPSIIVDGGGLSRMLTRGKTVELVEGMRVHVSYTGNA